jgi:conjugal transfer mating pair stabilization protein TraG
VESQSSQVNTDLNQAFPGYVESRIGAKARDGLFNHPGDLNSLHQLQSLGDDFIAKRRDELIADFGNKQHHTQVDSFYREGQSHLIAKEKELVANYQKNHDQLSHDAKGLDVGIDKNQLQQVQQDVQQHLATTKAQSENGFAFVSNERNTLMHETDKKMQEGKVDAQKNAALPESLARNRGLHHKDEDHEQ